MHGILHFLLLFHLIAFTIITVLKKTREKNTSEQDTKTKDEGAGHTTERGSKLSVPLREISPPLSHLLYVICVKTFNMNH